MTSDRRVFELANTSMSDSHPSGGRISVIGRKPKHQPYLRAEVDLTEKTRLEPQIYVGSLDPREMVWLMKAIAKALGYKVLKERD